jgi:predicted CXXCH cytochrome family protein
MKRLLLPTLALYLVLALPSVVTALDMASKRDCVVCHIMWLDDFRTDQETLVEFMPGNVLMKDTQGVVSSEDICFSCHDGYVRDSRQKVWRDHRHPVFVKPSSDVTIPPELPLSVKGEIYCGTCHSAHGKGAAPHGDPLGRTSVFRERNIDSSLCEKCHKKQARYKQYNGHPLHTGSIDLPEKLFRLGSKRATKDNILICQSCHAVHGAKGDRLLVVPNTGSELCVTCHRNRTSIIGTKHDLRITMPDGKNIKNQTPSASGPCGACHTPHKAAGPKLWARPVEQGNPAAILCLTCHGTDTPYRIKKIGRNSHPTNIVTGKRVEAKAGLPLFLDNGAESAEGTIQCVTCHDPHTWDVTNRDNKGGDVADGDSTNSFLRVSNAESGLCIKCHTDKLQALTSDHNLSVTAPEAVNIQGFTASVSGPCGACHVPHNAAARHLWAREIEGDVDFVTQLCTSCHRPDGPAGSKLIGKYYHPVDVSLERLNISTTLPLFDGEGNRLPQGKMVCITCHDPHRWNPDKVVIDDYSGRNIEGDATNSFLRKSNYPASGLCKSCHVLQALVDGTDHDLSVTAPDARNILGQTVKESGPCGACHLVHNSPNRIKLWARSYGKVGYDEDVIDALCRSCHSSDGIAAAKVPLIATHPQNKLINNIMRCDRTKIDFAPVFDKVTGEETHVGNISCPTCHNAHRWSPLSMEKGTGRNLEGNTTNSFLRNVSYNNICIDCHGLDALFRYKYFHNPDERVDTTVKVKVPVGIH